MNRFGMVWLGFVWVLILAAGCDPAEQVQEGACRRDSQCKQFERCDTMEFRCVCDTDEACASGEFCNDLGSCQRKTGCVTNVDCPAAVCDVWSAECIAPGQCTDDLQCEVGQICVLPCQEDNDNCKRGSCQTGCRESSDCDQWLRQVCLDQTCQTGRCLKNSDCDFGRLCDLASNQCVLATEHCAPCKTSCPGCAVGDAPCGDPADYCYPVGSPAPDDGRCVRACREGHDEEDCPAGYICAATPWLPSEVVGTCLNDNGCRDGSFPMKEAVVNSCEGIVGDMFCKISGQICEVPTDCYEFETICRDSACIFGFFCRPEGGCQ